MGQVTNALYQVDDTVYADGQPVYRLVMTAVENNEFRNIDRQSNAQMNATLINSDGVGTDIRYNLGMRVRGNNSRGTTPPSIRANFPNDQAWQGVSSVNLNTQYTHSQLVGMTMFRAAGLAAEDATAVQVRVNGENRARSGSPQYGSYVRLETPGSEWGDNHFPNDPAGNFYRGQNNGLEYRGEDPNSYFGRLDKKTNVSENDWSDIIALTRALDRAETPDNVFVETVEQVANIDQWMRFMAVNTLLVNQWERRRLEHLSRHQRPAVRVDPARLGHCAGSGRLKRQQHAQHLRGS